MIRGSKLASQDSPACLADLENQIGASERYQGASYPDQGKRQPSAAAVIPLEDVKGTSVQASEPGKKRGGKRADK
jgi:hypothetical protein